MRSAWTRLSVRVHPASCSDQLAPCLCREQVNGAQQSSARDYYHPTARGHHDRDHAQYRDQQLRRHKSASPPEAIGWIVNAVKVISAPSLPCPCRAPHILSSACGVLLAP